MSGQLWFWLACEKFIEQLEAISEKNGELCALPVGGECGFRIDSLI